MRRFAWITAATCLLQLAVGQDVRWRAVGQKDAWRLGPPMAVIGDRDGDGHRELVTFAAVPVSTWRTEIHTFVLSGRTGQLVSRVPIARTAGYYLVQNLVTVGDFDLDGVDDYARQVLGYGNNPNVVEVRSGKSDSVLWEIQSPQTDNLGNAMVGDLDVNGDGLPELVVSAAGSTSRRIYAFDRLGREVFRMPVHRMIPTGLAKIGDVDDDGCDDFTVHDGTTPSQGEVRIHSGRTQRVLRRCYGERSGDQVGSGPSFGCGDIDGDGVPDLVASTGAASGATVAFSGRTGGRLHVWRNLYPRAVADVDLDGVLDLICHRAFVDDRKYVYSLQTGAVIGELPGVQTTYFVSPPPRGELFPTLLGVEPFFSNGGSRLSYLGRITAMRSAPTGVRVAGAGCRGTASQAPGIGFLAGTSNAARIHLTGAPAGTSALLVVGISQHHWAGLRLPLDLASLGLPGCGLHNSGELLLTVPVGSTGIGRGRASVDVQRLPGVPVFGQWLTFDPVSYAPGALSPSLRF